MRGLGNTFYMKCELVDIACSCNLLDGGPEKYTKEGTMVQMCNTRSNAQSLLSNQYCAP